MTSEPNEMTDEELAGQLEACQLTSAAPKLIEEAAKRLRQNAYCSLLRRSLIVAKDGLEAADRLVDSYCPNPALEGDEIRVDRVRKAVKEIFEFDKETNLCLTGNLEVLLAMAEKTRDLVSKVGPFKGGSSAAMFVNTAISTLKDYIGGVP